MIHVQAFAFNTVQENTYLIYDDLGHGAIVDCGCMSSTEQSRLVDFCSARGITPGLLLNTHLHFDHCWGNPWAMRQWAGLRPHCHERELTHQPSPSEQFARFGLMIRFEDVPHEDYILVEQGQVLRLGELSLQVREVPGHSPGHVIYYCAEGGFAIAGDTLFYEDIGRTDLWGGNYDQLIAGIKSEMLSLPDETIVYTGHGDRTTIGYERQYNPYLR